MYKFDFDGVAVGHFWVGVYECLLFMRQFCIGNTKNVCGITEIMERNNNCIRYILEYIVRSIL